MANMKRLQDQKIRFWEVAWQLPNCEGGFSRSLFFHWEEMLELFTELYLDKQLKYSVSAYVHYAPLEPESLVKFLDEFVHNRTPTKDITTTIEYLVRVVEPMRKMVGTYNALVTWEKDRIAFREHSEPNDIEDLQAVLLSDRPVLLFGTILEIEHRKDSAYDVIFGIYSVHSENYDLESDYLVSLRADNSLVESLFEHPPTHTRPEHETPTIALFAEITNIDACNVDDDDRPPTLFGNLVEFYYSSLIFERSWVTEELVALLSDELDPRDFSVRKFGL